MAYSSGQHQKEAFGAGAASPATAAAPQSETLYEQLLRYHNEHDTSGDEGSPSHQRLRGKKNGSPTKTGDGLLDEQKPAARPKANRKSPPSSNTKMPPSSNHSGSSLGQEGGPSHHHSALDSRLNAARATAFSGGGKKPGIVAVDEAAIHPNSAMYRAAYGGGGTGGATTPQRRPAPSPINTRGGEVREATVLCSAGSDRARRARSRSPNLSIDERTRSSSPQLDHKDPLVDALCVSARTPLATVHPSLAAAGSVHTATAATTPMMRGGGVKLSPVMDPLAQHNPKFFESIDDSLDVKPRHSKASRSKSPKLVRRHRKNDKSADPKGLDRSSHREKSSSMDRSSHSDKGSPSEKSSPQEKDRKGAMDRSGHREKKSKKGKMDRSGDREKKADRRGAALDRSGHREPESEPRESQPSKNLMSLSTGDMPLFAEFSAPGRRTPSRTHSDHMQQMKKPPPTTDPVLQRPRGPPSSGKDNRKPPPQYSQGVQSRPKTVSRTVSDPAATLAMPAKNRTRHYSNDSFDMDGDLKLALELSMSQAGDANVGSSNSARGPRTAAKLPPSADPHPAGSSHGSSHDRSYKSAPANRSESSPKHQKQPKKPAKAATQGTSLMEHFSSSFAEGARKKVADDEGSLADVLLALKLSAEEAAHGKGKSKERSHLPNVASRMSTSLRELLELEQATTKQEAGDDGSVTTKDSSVIDLVAAGISTDQDSSSADAEKQLRILQQIREEEERRQLEIALKASKNSDEDIDDDLDADLKLALEASRNEAERRRSSNFVLSQQQAMQEFSAKKPAALDPDQSKEVLLQRGTAETHRAISEGQAQIVACRGCGGRLQAPRSYSLVFCPKCQTISPIGS